MIGQPQGVDGVPLADKSITVRLPWVDAIRAGGAFLVVMAHVALYPSLKGSGPLWAQSMYYTVTRVAVPLFFMASGFLLLGRQESLGDFYRKRAVRVFVPFLLWSFVYFAWNGGFSDSQLTPATIFDGLLRILRGPRAAHLWFFYVLIGLYLITPTLRIFTAHAKDSDLLYFCALWFLLDPVLSWVRYTTSTRVGFEFQFLTGYIGYYVLGFFLGRVKPTRLRLLTAAAILFLSFAFLWSNVYVGQQQAAYDQFYEGYLSLVVVPFTVSTFFIIRSMSGLFTASVLRWIAPLSKATLGIYLLHVLVLELLAAEAVPLLPILEAGSSVWVMPVTAASGFLACFLIVALLQRLPVVKYSVP